MIMITMTITMAMMKTIMIALSCWCRLSTVEASSCYSEEVHNEERMGRQSKIVTVSLSHYLLQQAADRLQLPLLRSVHPHFRSYYVREKDDKVIVSVVINITATGHHSKTTKKEGIQNQNTFLDCSCAKRFLR